ncbi:hypothetical protein PAECIP112173_00372 [Paenibacillus sp. JJ-100]|uniref:DUF7667 family protein n=1 Tax=Paenibacillus sp. JJ-100 TaxID=2974896 RepID=UPI0022FF55E0|nr:hypothetical protein [Paenibacillus sp. JJ-100]CAI6024165.1 hypothetical protein PAECIP112173_00372 [Paenibacillus sp. JJ-100]
MSIAIHKIHRAMAQITMMNTDKQGNLILGELELKLIFGLLRKNLELVYEIDGLKEIAFAAQSLNQMDLVQHVCARLDELEVQLT